LRVIRPIEQHGDMRLHLLVDDRHRAAPHGIAY
jgi:hypothetical protein